MDNLHDEDPARVFDPDELIPMRRAMALIMPRLRIHDVDKPHDPSDDAVSDPFGKAQVTAFLLQQTPAARVAVTFCGALGRSVPISQAFAEHTPMISDQASLDVFLAAHKEIYAKPVNYDYSTSTASIRKGDRGYIGRDFHELLLALQQCQRDQLALDGAARLTMKAVNNYGEFLNSHFWFQLLLYAKLIIGREGVEQDPLITYVAQLSFPSKLPLALVSRRNTLKFFTNMVATGAKVVPIKPRELPEENLPFCVFKKQDSLDNAYDFADSVVRKLTRLRDLDIVARFKVCVAPDPFIIKLPGRVWRPDNILVQTCMAQRTYEEMGALDGV
jgi:hypothetical protein